MLGILIIPVVLFCIFLNAGIYDLVSVLTSLHYGIVEGLLYWEMVISMNVWFCMEWVAHVMWFYIQGTIIIKTGEELMNFSKGEENQVEEVSIV